MKIISNFRDYYDSASFVGAAYDLHYIRKSAIYPFDVMVEGSFRIKISKWREIAGDRVGIGGRIFCEQYTYGEGRDYDKLISLTYTDITNTYTDKQIADIFNKYGPVWQYTYYKGDLKAAQNNISYQRQLRMRYHDNPYILSNGCLGESFAKVVPPHVAYIEIERLLSNTARPDKPIPAMTNDIKIHQHGFDKFSFRSNKNQREH